MIYRVWIEIHVEAESRAGVCVAIDQLYRSQRLPSDDIVKLEPVPETAKARREAETLRPRCGEWSLRD